MSWNDRNPDLEPWDIPDREIHPQESGGAPSAGDQWMQNLRNERAQRKKQRRRPQQRDPAPLRSLPRDELHRKLDRASRMTNAAAIVFGIAAALLFIPALVAAIDTYTGIRAGDAFFSGGYLFAGEAMESAAISLAVSGLCLFWGVMSVALWRKSRTAGVLSVAVSFIQLVLFTAGGLGILALPVFVLAIVGMIGAFSYHTLRRPVVGGETIGDRRPLSWKPETTLGRVFLGLLAALCVCGLVCTAVSAALLGEAVSGTAEDFVYEEEWEETPVADEDGWEDNWEAEREAELRTADPVYWQALKIPGASLSLPLPEDVELTDDENYHSAMYTGDVTCFHASAYWYEEDLSAMTEEQAFETLEGLLEGYGEYEDERVAVPLTTGVTDDGIYYAQVSIESDFGYVYALRAFLTDSAVGCLTYDRYDYEEWSQEFEELANSWFTKLKKL